MRVSLVLAVLGLLFAGLALFSIYGTNQKIAAGGDVVHINMDNAPVAPGQTLSRGTYVVTRDGFVPLSWYWVYKYAYLTVPGPLVLAVAGIVLFLRRKRAGPPAAVAA